MRGSFTVPHCKNRVVIFDLDLFHRTADLDFRPCYQHRPVNVTLLFGYRRTAWDK